VRAIANDNPRQAFIGDVKPPKMDSKRDLLKLVGQGLKSGISYMKSIPGTVGTVAQGMELAIEYL
jgi:hypothetical protein